MSFDIEEFLRVLRDKDALRDKDEVQHEEVDRIEPKYFDGDLSELGLSEKVAEAVRKELGDNRLYQHQADAIKSSVNGGNIVLESPTASGKTLSFAAPMLESVCGGGTALMVYPMKAVAQDQERQLRICDSLGIEYSPFHGGMTQTERRDIWKSHPRRRILFTTPETIHNNFLWWSKNHVEFLKRLSFLVLDEAHEYRGYFGGHMAQTVRRLLALLDNKMNRRPKIFVATATCANPQEHAESLTGQDFRLVSTQDVLRPRRHFVFVNHQLPDFDFMKIFRVRIVNAAMACLHLQHSALVFCPSIAFAGQVALDAKKAAQKAGLNPADVAVFFAGLPDGEKNRVLQGLQNESLKIVFCTNALELGIDVKGLDGVILAGFPDNIAAARQRFGRAGRSWDSNAFVLYYPMNNPLDKFVAADLPGFLGRSLDPVVVDPKNEEAIEKHEPCIKPDATQNREDIGRAFHNYEWINQNMRGDMASYTLKADGRDVGSISGTRQFREAYIGAVLVHNGEVYKVDNVDYKENIVYLVTETRNVRTVPEIETKTDIGTFKIFDESERPWGTTYLRTINIGMRMVNYKLVDERTGSILESYNNANNVFYNNDRHAFVMNVCRISEADDVAVRTLEQILRVGALFTVPAFRHDTSTWSKAETLYLYENYPGGIGVARQVFEKWREVMHAGVKIAEACKCKTGCALCVVPPRKTDDKIDKREGIKLARSILKSEEDDA